jgi:hypothetical protein
MNWKRPLLILVILLWFEEGRPWELRRVKGSAALATGTSRGPRPGDQTVTLFVRDGSLHAVLGDVSNQAGARLKVRGLKERPVTVEASGLPVQKLMDDLCEDLDCRWKLETYLVVWPAGEPTPEWSLAGPDGKTGG